MIGSFTLREVASRLDARWEESDLACSGVSTDTRQLQAGDLFVALRGERHDGHHHLGEALARGAVAAVVEQPVDVCLPQLQVYDSRRALGELALMNRERFTGKVMGLTGSAGKTTTKNMLAAIFSRLGSTLATAGNLNNEIGVPLTVLSIAESHGYAVVEMGAAHRGDIAYLMQFVKPDAVLITNAMPAHLAGFGSLEVIAQTKGEIYQCLPESAVAVLNVDDPHAGLWRQYIGKHTLVTFGWQGETRADVTAHSVRLDAQGCASFQLQTPGGDVSVTLPLPGLQNVSNALGAAAMAVALGCSPAQVADGLAACRGEPGRLTLRASRSGCRLVDDSYNANPGSVKSAIDWLAAMPAPRVLILGEMAELGEAAQRLHIEVAEHAERRGIEQIWLVGPWAGAMQSAVPRVRVFPDQAALVAYAEAHVTAADTVLVKGSRMAHMESVVDALASESRGGKH